MPPAPTLPRDLASYLAVDLAIGQKETNDYTVILPFSVDVDDNIYFRESCVRDRLTSYEIVERILDLATQYDVEYIAIETGHISKAIGPVLNKRMQERGKYFAVWDAVPSKDKQTRAASLRARMQQKKIFLPDCQMFRETVLPELLSFPAGKHDDLTDAMAWSCIMLDDIRTPRARKTAAQLNPEPGSWDWMQTRVKRTTGQDQTHKPQAFGRPKPKKDSW